jgi:hypothetical protein
MNERIKNLYDLFLQAKEKGHNITFRHGCMIDIILYDCDNNVKSHINIMLVSAFTNFYFQSAEQFLNKLIGSDVK